MILRGEQSCRIWDSRATQRERNEKFENELLWKFAESREFAPFTEVEVHESHESLPTARPVQMINK